MIGDDTEGVQPWMQVPAGPVRDLIFAYEAILTEMRTHGYAGNRTISEWVKRLDFARDEFVHTEYCRASDARGPAQTQEKAESSQHPGSDAARADLDHRATDPGRLLSEQDTDRLSTIHDGRCVYCGACVGEHHLSICRVALHRVQSLTEKGST